MSHHFIGFLNLSLSPPFRWQGSRYWYVSLPGYYSTGYPQSRDRTTYAVCAVCVWFLRTAGEGGGGGRGPRTCGARAAESKLLSSSHDKGARVSSEQAKRST